jgi:hypothetical protein
MYSMDTAGHLACLPRVTTTIDPVRTTRFLAIQQHPVIRERLPGV